MLVAVRTLCLVVRGLIRVTDFGTVLWDLELIGILCDWVGGWGRYGIFRRGLDKMLAGRVLNKCLSICSKIGFFSFFLLYEI